MINTLFGKVEDNRDFARKVIIEGVNLPFYRLLWQITPHGVSLDIQHEDAFERDCGKVLMNGGGLYCIYRKKDNRMECLYVGYSKSSIGYRLYRFFKELAGRSRPDENHPAAKKAREDGVKTSDNFYVKMMPLDYLPKMPEDGYYIIEKLDEYIANLLKSKYNTQTQI